MLGFTRFCLGLGEPGLWVAAPKAVGEVMKKSQRSLAVGIYTAGATLGAIVAIPAILVITAHLPWKTIFLIDGAVGLLWVPVWLWLYQDHAQEPLAPSHPRTSVFRDVIGRRETWQFMIARGMTDPVWYFYLFWFPKFLLSERHLSNSQLSQFGWIVYFAGGLGTIAGGFLSGSIIRSGVDPGRAYRRTMLCSAAAVLVSPLAYLSPQVSMVILFASIVALAHMSWLINLTSTLLEVFPIEQIGKAAGLIAAGSAVGGMLSSEIIGYFVSHGGYRSVFFIMGWMHPLAIMLLWTAFNGKPIRISGSTTLAEEHA
jgi:ACS family hexuronate transporter-like MFS transporter